MNWKVYKLWDFLTESKIVSEKPDSNKRITVRLNVNWVEKRPDKNDVKWATKYFIRSKWQFIYWKQNLHKWAFWIIPDNLDWYETTSDIPTFDIDTNICLPDMLMYFLKQNDYYKNLEWLAKWVWSKRIHPAQIFELEIYLPSIDIQKEILSKSLLKESKVQDLLKITDKNLSYIKQLKQAILQEAIEWKLTTSWRKENSWVESAFILLEKIKKEKEELIKQKKLKKQEKLKDISVNEIPFEIPENWSWCRLGEICNNIHYWFNASANEKKLETRLLRITDIQDDKVNWETVPWCIINENEIERYKLSENDILIARTGWTIWKSYLVKNLTVSSVFASYLIRLIPNHLIDANFLKKYLWSSLYWEQLIENSWWAAQPNVNWTALNNLIFPLPPLEEQKEIVKKVDEMIKFCDELEKQSLETKENSENLMKSVLSEVFSK